MPPTLSKLEIINKSKDVHGENTFGYDKFISLTTIIRRIDNIPLFCFKCKIDFEIKLGKHLDKNTKRGCPECGKMNRSLKQVRPLSEFISIAEKVHVDNDNIPLYDYTYVVYINSNIKVKIWCKIHKQIFEMLPGNHINGSKQGCSKCGVIKKADSQKTPYLEVIKKFIEVHGNFYYYFLVDYINTNTIVIIICPIHGEFEMRPADHIRGQRCAKCYHKWSADQQRKSNEDYKKDAHIVHNNKYCYDKVIYENTRSMIIIICHNHDKPFEFVQRASAHLEGQGCPLCSSHKSEKECRYVLESLLNKDFVKC